jgi:hypothetical protein
MSRLVGRERRECQTFLHWAVLCGLALTACGPSSESDVVLCTTPGLEPYAVGGPPSASGLVGGAPSASAATELPKAPPAYVKRDRPSAEEWATAPDLPAVPPYGPKVCLGKRLGDWILVRSSGGQSPQLLDAFPNKDGRLFTGAQQLELRLLPGDEVRVECAERHGWSKLRTKVFLAWPMDEPEPLRVEVREVTGATPSGLESEPPVPVPVSPPGTTPRPMPGDWAKSAAVNTAPKGSRHGDCDLRFLRGWGRLRCVSNGALIWREQASFGDFGKVDADYYVRREFNLGEIVFRTEPGRSIRFEWSPYIGAPLLRVEWPAGADRPSVLAVETKG